MNLSYFERDEFSDNLIKRLDGRVKTIVFLEGIIVSVFLTRWYLVLLIFGVSLLIFYTLKVPWKNLLKRLIMPFGISWFVFLNLIFTNGKSIVYSFHLGHFILPIYKEGIQLGILIQMRIMAAVTVACLMALTTPMIEILETLRLCKVPSIMVDIADTMYRYVFIIQDTAVNVRNAQLSRMGDRASWIRRVRDFGSAAEHVLIESLDRSVRIYKAMLARGYNEESRTMKFFNNAVPKCDLYCGILTSILLCTLVIINIFV